MNYHTLSTPNTNYTLKTPQYYHKTGQKGKEKSLHEIKYNPDQYSILGERTLEFLKKRERGGVARDDIEVECLDVLMALDVENGLQAAHYEDQVMLEKALQRITQMAKDNNNLRELKDLLNVLVNQRKQLKEKEDAFLNSLSVFIDFYARGDFELIQKGIIKDDFLVKELEQLHKLLAQKGKLMHDRKRFHFDLNSFLQQPAKPPTPVIEYEPVVEKVITPPPPKKEPERPQCNLWNFEHPALRDWRANFLGPQFPYHTFTIEQLMLLLGQRQQPTIQVLPPLHQSPPTNIYMGGMPPFQAPNNLKMEWPYVTGLSHRFPRGATTEVEQLEYLKAMEADLLLNLRKTPPFSPEYGVQSAHLNLIRQLLGNYDKKKYHWLDYSHEIVSLPSQTIKPTKLIHYQVPFDQNEPQSLRNISTAQQRVGSSPNITVERSETPGRQNIGNIIPGQQFPPGNHTQKITQKYRMKINVNDVEGINGFRFKFHKMEKFMEKYGNSIAVRGALLFGDEVYIDKNGDNCSFSAVVNGRRSESDPYKVIGRAKRDFDIDMRPVISEFHTIEDLEKFKLLLNIFDKDGKLIGWEVFPMYTNLRFNKGRYTCCLNAPPTQKPPFSDPKTPLDIEMQHEIIPLPCPDSDDDSDDEYMRVTGRQKKFYNNNSSHVLDGFDDPADRIRIDDDSLERNRHSKYRMPIHRKKGDGMFDDEEDGNNKNNSFRKNQQSQHDKQNPETAEEKKFNNDRQKRNMLKLSDFENIHGFRLKFNTIKNYDMKKGGNVTVRLAVVYGQQVIKDLNGLQCADSQDIVGLASKTDKTGLDLDYLRDFDIDLYDLVEQYDYTELEKFYLIANFFDGEGNQIGWHIVPLFKYRKFNKGKTNTFMYEPPALPPPFEGKKENSKFKIETELIPFPIDKDVDITADKKGQNLNSSALKLPSQNRNTLDSSRNNNNNSILKSNRSNLNQPQNAEVLNSSMNNNSLLKQNDTNNSLIKPKDGKKSVIPNIKETDKAIQIKFKNLKNYDMSKGNQVTIRGSIIFGDDIMVDDNDLRCAYNKQFQATVSSERNTLTLNQDCIYNLNPNQLQVDYDIKQLESIQMYYSIFDQQSNQIGWLVFPLFKNKRMNKGTFTNYLLEPPAQQPPFNLSSIKNSKTRLEYEIMTSEQQADHQNQSEQSSQVSDIGPAGVEQPEFNNKIGISMYFKEIKNQKEKISIAYHLKICDGLNTKLILSRDNQPCYFETDSVFDPDTKLKNNLIDEKVFFLLDPERLKKQSPNYQNIFLSIFFLKENPTKIEEGESPYGWYAQGLFDAKGVFKKGTFIERIFKLPEQQQYPLDMKSLKKIDSSIEFTIEIVDVPNS